MGNSKDDDGDAAQQHYTTNAQDRQAAADLQARLLFSNVNESNNVHHNDDEGDDEDDDEDGTGNLLPSVSIDEGAHKYVLITATSPSPSNSSQQTFVYSRRHAKYHVNVAEEFVPQLECYGYTSIRVAGGGRILRNDTEKKIHIFGYSYGFGKADHAVAKEIVELSGNYRGYEITWYVGVNVWFCLEIKIPIVVVQIIITSCPSTILSLFRSNEGY